MRIILNKYSVLIISFLLLGVVTSKAQSFNLGFLFNSGAVLATDYYVPSAVNDSVNFENIKYKFKITQALKTKMGVDLAGFNFKKMDAKASQIFLNYGAQVTQPRFSENNNLENIYRLEAGITAITASIRKGIWVYSADIYLDESESTLSESPVPNFKGYFANINIKSLKFQYFYGAGVVVNQGKIYPFPVIGFRNKFNSKWKLDLVIPQHVKLNYTASKKVNLDLATNFSGINAVYRQGSAIENNDNTLNLRRVKSYFSLNAKLGSHYKLRTELGYAYLQQINHLTTDYSLDVAATPYASIAINYYFGKSVFGNFLNRIE